MSESNKSHEMLEHAWRYFELHAKQRMSTFNFYVVLSGLVTAGLAVSFRGPGVLHLIGVASGMALALFSFVFWKLDQRVAFLVKHAENALVELEIAYPEASARLFTHEPSQTNAAQQGPFWRTIWTYGKSFPVVFWAMGLFGLSASALSVARFLGWEPGAPTV